MKGEPPMAGSDRGTTAEGDKTKQGGRAGRGGPAVHGSGWSLQPAPPPGRHNRWRPVLRRCAIILLALLASFMVAGAVFVFGVGFIGAVQTVGLTPALPDELFGNFAAVLVFAVLAGTVGLVLLSPLLLPLLVVVESRRVTSLRAHLLVAGIAGLLVGSMITLGQADLPDDGAPPAMPWVGGSAEGWLSFLAIVLAALAGGVVYWRLAGARAGHWLDAPILPARARSGASKRTRDIAPDPEGHEPLPLATILDTAASMFRSEAAERRIELRVVASSLVVEANAVALIRMLGTMLTTAIEAGAGTVRLGARRRGARCDVEIWVRLAATTTPPCVADLAEVEALARAAQARLSIRSNPGGALCLAIRGLALSH